VKDSKMFSVPGRLGSIMYTITLQTESLPNATDIDSHRQDARLTSHTYAQASAFRS
jgi:hypothetical protein